jgi:hypothetical protein
MAAKKVIETSDNLTNLINILTMANLIPAGINMGLVSEADALIEEGYLDRDSFNEALEAIIYNYQINNSEGTEEAIERLNTLIEEARVNKEAGVEVTVTATPEETSPSNPVGEPAAAEGNETEVPFVEEEGSENGEDDEEAGD